MIRVTLAREEDLPALLDLLMLMGSENALMPMDVDKVVATVRDVLNRGLIWLAWQDGSLVGTLAVSIETLWYSSAPLVEERWMYVMPQARNSVAFLRMLRLAQRVARDKQMPAVFSVVTRTDLARKAKAFRRLEEVGRVFLMEEV